eukprot:CAMPEP_0170747538 /NCGR_PEP_ID=MMETSP0437-20130122/9373_1 /TAXON_ID=0 /ORGANISM="Sexangularia sp." /LENGTH=125 /DNA_ID=CAMNT_0011086317 /DNA_START=102 /DNA_END=479 /DNA_ORIENTATION=-
MSSAAAAAGPKAWAGIPIAKAIDVQRGSRKNEYVQIVDARSREARDQMKLVGSFGASERSLLKPELRTFVHGEGDDAYELAESLMADGFSKVAVVKATMDDFVAAGFVFEEKEAPPTPPAGEATK